MKGAYMTQEELRELYKNRLEREKQTYISKPPCPHTWHHHK